MPLLVSQAIGHAVHELGKELAVQIDPLSVINMAGEHLTSMRAWNWLVRPPRTLGFQAGVEYIELPDDFGDLRALYAFDSLNNTVLMVSPEEVAFLRATDLGNDTNTMLIAMVSAASGYYLDKPPVARFELSQTPTVSLTKALSMVYRARWPRRTKDDQYIPIDPSCDLLYVEIVRQIAQGFQKSHEGTAGTRLVALEQGATFHAAASFDIRRLETRPPRRLPGMRLIWPTPKVSS